MADVEFSFDAVQIRDAEMSELKASYHSLSCGNKTGSSQEMGVEQRIDTITLTRCDN